jgi:group II intron reverse transcriptase/maturase
MPPSPVPASAPLTLAETVTVARLRESWQATLLRDPRPGPDGETAPLFALSAEERLASLHADIQGGRYRPHPAWRMWVPREHAGPRGVVALSITDRIVEGALLRGLRARLEGQLSEASYAYRQGLGALQAAQSLITSSKAHHWALRGDIAECFDSIPHLPLRASLQGTVDAPLDALLHVLLTRPVTDRSGTLHVRRGLCQGSLLAPLLSNWYLDAFDKQLGQHGLKLVRYADDFVVLTSSPQEAGQAALVADEALQALGLTLNPRKTRIVSLTGGFDFLGFTFRGGDVRIAAERLHHCQHELRTLLQAARGQGGAPLKAANNLIRGWQAYYRLGNVRLDLEQLDQWTAQTFPGVPLARFAPAPSRVPSGYRLLRQDQIRRGHRGQLQDTPRQDAAQTALGDLSDAVSRHAHPAFRAAALVAQREAEGALQRGSARVAVEAAYTTAYGSWAVKRRDEARQLLEQDARRALLEAGGSRTALSTASPVLAELLLPVCFDRCAEQLAHAPEALRTLWDVHMDTPVHGMLTPRILLYREAFRLVGSLRSGTPYLPWTQG